MSPIIFIARTNQTSVGGNILPPSHYRSRICGLEILPRPASRKMFQSHTKTICRIFYIDDYSVNKRKGSQYDVLYEDLGLDEVESLLDMLSEDHVRVGKSTPKV